MYHYYLQATILSFISVFRRIDHIHQVDHLIENNMTSSHMNEGTILLMFTYAQGKSYCLSK